MPVYKYIPLRQISIDRAYFGKILRGLQIFVFGDVLILVPWTDHGGKLLSLKGRLKSREAVGVPLRNET